MSLRNEPSAPSEVSWAAETASRSRSRLIHLLLTPSPICQPQTSTPYFRYPLVTVMWSDVVQGAEHAEGRALLGLVDSGRHTSAPEGTRAEGSDCIYHVLLERGRLGVRLAVTSRLSQSLALRMYHSPPRRELLGRIRYVGWASKSDARSSIPSPFNQVHSNPVFDHTALPVEHRAYRTSID